MADFSTIGGNTIVATKAGGALRSELDAIADLLRGKALDGS